MFSRHVLRVALCIALGALPAPAQPVTEELPEDVPLESLPGEEVAPPYVLPDSDRYPVRPAALRALTREQLSLARNEIYARHGRLFRSNSLQRHFDQRPWYRGDAGYAEPPLRPVERLNVEAIQREERARGGPVRWP